MSEIASPDDRLPVGLEISRNRDAHGVVLTLHGELDLASAPEVERQLGEIQRDRPERLLIDLSDVSFMDSTGLKLLIDAQNASRADGFRLAVRRGRPQVQRLFELTGVTEHFSFED